VRPVVGFVAGVVIGGLAAAFAQRALSHAADEREGSYWHRRAQTAERELGEERAKNEGIARQLQELAARFDSMAARLEALSTAADVSGTPPEATPSPNGS
jgi:uncharacterized membrane-anchored protein YhcB (DUF1043 family)